jgi:hypothetical protein
MGFAERQLRAELSARVGKRRVTRFLPALGEEF